MGDRLSGAVSDHELLSIAVDPPVLPTEVESHALAASREKALTITDDRRMLLTACAVEVERELKRIVWPGSSGARTSTAVVIVRDHTFSVASSPLYPDVSGVAAVLTSLRRWDDDAQAWVTLSAPDDYRTLPGARIIVDVAGRYEIVSSLTAPATAPPNAIEAVARLWAYRETLRPGDLSEIAGEQQVLAGGMMKSGAAEVLRGEKWRVNSVISLRDHGLMERAELQITGDYTQQRLSAMYNAVSGAVVMGGVAAVEAVAGRVSRLMEVAQVSGGPRAKQALTPTVLAMIGRNLIEWGESLHMLKYRVAAGRIEFYLCPAQHEWTVYGRHRPRRVGGGRHVDRRADGVRVVRTEGRVAARHQ